MYAMLDWLLPAALLVRGRSSLADALRAVAATLEGVADAIDPRASVAGRSMREAASAGDAPPPGAGTRERIAEALQRARSRYDAVSDPTSAARRPR
ncbi:MAG: hypothetical protein AB1689_25825 [Thermodesulfobacteriota bacterium]